MNAENTLLILLALLVFVVIGATLALAVASGSRVGRRVRNRLVLRLRRTPFARMLRRRHVDVEGYANRVPLSELEQELLGCEQCARREQCEQVLAQPVDSAADYSFCPNDPVIRRLEEEVRGTKP
jgi:hypothetical protein